MATLHLDNILVPDLGSVLFSEAEAARTIDRYLNSIGRIMATPSTVSLYDFFKLVQNAVLSREHSEDVPTGKNILVMGEDFIRNEEVNTEAITFHLKARYPGQLNRGQAGDSRIREVVPHLRRIDEHPDHPSERLVTMGKFYDNYVIFTVWARDNKTALKRLFWFENVMDSFRWYFKLYGVEAQEDKVGEKETETVKGLDLVKYPITYFVRTEDTFSFGTQELKRLVLDIDVSTQ